MVNVPTATVADTLPTYTVFDGARRIAQGALSEAAVAVHRATHAGSAGPVLLFDDRSGGVVDIDTRGSEQDVARRYRAPPVRANVALDTLTPPRGRGRPRLGVVAREVTLLAEHWEWLAAQPGGSSAALRRLVDAKRRSSADTDRARQQREAAYRFMHALAGDFVSFEEATRALFAGDIERFRREISAWPNDVAAYALDLGFRSERA